MKETIMKLSANIHIKAMIAIVAMLFSWAFDGESQILLAVGSIVFLDTITGVYAVIKMQGFSGYKSREFSRVLGKVIRYAIFMYVSRIIDKSLPRHVFAPMIDVFILTTEGSSIMENFAKMGYPVPVGFILKLKQFMETKKVDNRP